MRYPNGHSYQPTSKRPKKRVQDNFAKRGMRLEDMINAANDWYNSKDLAVIHKKPTPIQVVKVDYPKRSRAVIKEAYYRQASTTDYNGIYKGYYIDFEAKQTDLVKHFPLRNIHDHQVKHMAACDKQGGICFLLIYFKSLDSCYLYPFSELKIAWDNYQNGGKSQLSLEHIQQVSYPVQSGFRPRLDYLKAVDQMLNR